jgi:hypothetical protein
MYLQPTPLLYFIALGKSRKHKNTTCIKMISPASF